MRWEPLCIMLEARGKCLLNYFWHESLLSRTGKVFRSRDAYPSWQRDRYLAPFTCLDSISRITLRGAIRVYTNAFGFDKYFRQIKNVCHSCAPLWCVPRTSNLCSFSRENITKCKFEWYACITSDTAMCTFDDVCAHLQRAFGKKTFKQIINVDGAAETGGKYCLMIYSRVITMMYQLPSNLNCALSPPWSINIAWPQSIFHQTKIMYVKT